MMSKILVPIIILLNIIFTGIILWIFYKTQTEPTELIRCWFAFTTGELWFLATIKKAKVKNNDK
jgi:threonine/homoserine efflux transporter RhtA